MPQKYNDLVRDILAELAVAGLITVSLTSPFFLSNTAKFLIKNRKYFKRMYDKNKIARALERMKRNRLIILREFEDKFTVELTEKGKIKIEEINFENMEIKKPSLWDGKWRIIIFDIPDKPKRSSRDALRDKLQKLGFYQLQKSVWVCPYPCEKEIQFLCALFDIYEFVNIITSESIYNDTMLRNHFKLL